MRTQRTQVAIIGADPRAWCSVGCWRLPERRRRTAPPTHQTTRGCTQSLESSEYPKDRGYRFDIHLQGQRETVFFGL